MKHKLLFVDDEINVLKSIKRIFTDTEYQVIIETDCVKALEIIKENQISVLVSDMRMPVMDGVELIKAANKIDPACIKLILSGYSELDDIMAALNEGHIYSYITKPWHDASIRKIISNACNLYESIINEKILIQKLKENQDELLNLNRNLEKIVEERTLEIRETNILLNCIISGMPEEEFVQKTTETISRALSVSNTALWNARNYKIFHSNEMFNFDMSLIEKVKDTGKPAVFNNLLVIPLLKKSILLGIAVVEKNDADSNYIMQRIDNILSALKLYFSQQLLIDESRDVISTIDSLIGEIDNA